MDSLVKVLVTIGSIASLGFGIGMLSAFIVINLCYLISLWIAVLQKITA